MDDEMSFMSIFGILAGPLGWIMQLIYNLIQSYGWTIIIFTFLVRILMFPLTLKQQKSQARMSAFQPMIQEIQEKWKNDRNRQQQEIMKFQEENGVKMSAGCLPMVVNMVVLFGIIAVIQAPLQYMINMPADQIANAVSVVEHYDPGSEISKNTYTKESILIGEVLDNRDNTAMFTDGVEVKDADGNVSIAKVDKEWIDKVLNFKFEFMGMNLAKTPQLALDVYLILPILSILTMFGSQLLTMKTSGQTQGKGSMWMMTIVMGAFFGWYAFTVPVGFSLYYTASNIVMALQQLLVKKIHDPEKVKQEIAQEIEERKKAKKAKKQVVLKDSSGKEIVKEMSEAELARLRIAKARELDEQRYGDDKDADAKGELKGEEFEELAELEEAGDQEVLKMEADSPEQLILGEVDEDAQQAQIEAVKAKPGRRKRARQNKENKAESFVEKEKATEDAEKEQGEG
ncbi:YidC/Oxa1 family membrane protein insertase [Ruminococcaceae bacterium OttesenSCG-928-A16]|nr:YidC/Oxa1 family membrane protein insertase [Ruminococcaceae bacterium OttesenSCG-928-A16]